MGPPNLTPNYYVNYSDAMDKKNVSIVGTVTSHSCTMTPNTPDLIYNYSVEMSLGKHYTPVLSAPGKEYSCVGQVGAVI